MLQEQAYSTISNRNMVRGQPHATRLAHSCMAIPAPQRARPEALGTVRYRTGISLSVDTKDQTSDAGPFASRPNRSCLRTIQVDR